MALSLQPLLPSPPPPPARRRVGVGVVSALALACLIAFGCRSVPARGEGGAQPARPARAPAPPPQPAGALRMVAVGDIMLDRNVGARIQSNGAASILARVREQTRGVPLTFGNLECPLSSTGPHDAPNCSFRARPETVAVLVDGGFDIVSLANNHSLNAGREALLQTLATLEANHIAYVGARRERERGWEPTFLNSGGLKVGFLAYTDLSFEHGSYSKIRPDRQAACEQVTSTRKQCDLLFVSIHWGEEYQTLPDSRQRNTARALIDAGADCILGHHPHTLQGIGIYRGRPILYSMGNFVFDQREGERMESAIFDIWYKPGGAWQIRATPIWISRERMGPIYPATARALKIARRLRDISAAVGTSATLAGTHVIVRSGK